MARRSRSAAPTRRAPGSGGARRRGRALRAAAATVCTALLGALVLAGCAAGSALDLARSDRPVVLTTFTVLADMARGVAGEHLEIASITKPGAEIHGYEPTPGDIAKASQADLILDNGMGLEAWFGQFVEQVDVPHVVVSAGVDPLDITGDAYAGRPNPHAWMSPVSARTYIDNMAAAFSELDPEHAADYAANAAAYKQQLLGIEEGLRTRLAELPEDQRVLVTCEGAFSYLARDAGLQEEYIWPVNAEQQATPQQIAHVIEVVDAQDVPAVFCESTVSDRPMQQVVDATGARYGGVLYVDSLSLADGPVPTYLDLLRHDADTIVTALTGEPA